MSAGLKLLIFYTLLTSINSYIDLDSPIGLARCRAICLYKMQTPSKSAPECWKSLNCSQGPGCQEACQFHPQPRSPVSAVPLEEVLVVNLSSVSWPPTPGPAVYVVMADGSQLCQTLQTTVTLPSTVDPATVRVMVVDWRGLVKVYCPAAESPIDQTLHILQSLGMENTLGFPSHGEGNSQYPSKQMGICQLVWRLNVESIIHHPPLVMVEISWWHYHNQLIKVDPVTYLITWSMDNGVLRGNSLTNDSNFSLSLLPDTLYIIQVSRPDEDCHSELLELDTHRSFSIDNKSSVQWSLDTSEATLTTPRLQYEGGATVLVLIVMVVVVALRWRHNRLSRNGQCYERI